MKIGIAIHDYRLEYAVENKLKEGGYKFKIVSEDSIDWCDVVITDYLHGRSCVICHDEKECFRKLQSRFYGKKRFEKLIVGIDPGPKPGIAVVGDGNVVEEIQLSSLKNVRPVLDEISLGYEPDVLIVRIGDGDIANRNRIINSLVDRYVVEMVNEENTSESILNRNVEAAKVIAFTRGKRVRERLNVVVTEGYIREIQRKSRIESGGKLTISRNLARRVALGELTLKEAIDSAERGK